MDHMPYYPDDYEQSLKPQKKEPARRGIGGLILLVTIVALIAGAAGAYLMNRYGGALMSPTAAHAPVTLQTVASTGTGGNDTPLQGGTLIEQVAAQTQQSIVEVSTEGRATHPFWGSYVTSGAGSGVILSADGYIATNDHVISGMDSIAVRLPDGTLYEGVLVGTDAQTDLAVLKINATGLTPVTFADSDAVVVGELAIAVGNPLGTLGGTVTEGIISAKDREIIIGGESMVLLQTSAAISPGNSGGGLFDQSGNLVGIVNAKSGEENVEGIGFAIPSNTAKTVLASLIENGYVSGRPVLGVETTTVSSLDALYRYNVSRPGIYVTETTQGSSLARGDRIVAIDGMEVSSTSEIKAIVGRHEVGETIEVEIIRNSRQGTIDVELLERGANAAETMV